MFSTSNISLAAVATGAPGDGGILVRDPATDEVLATVADLKPEDAVEVFEGVARNQPDWARSTRRERADVLIRAYGLMIDRLSSLAHTVSRENGKPLAEAEAEVRYAAEYFRWFGEMTAHVEGHTSASPDGRVHRIIERRPVGPCVLITPWNFPAAMVTRKLAPALAAGCVAVLKPASETPLTALAIVELLGEAGLPAGVVEVITTSRSGDVVGALLAHRAARKVSFTGSTEVGRVILARAAENVLRSSMELGGNAPFVVLGDADLEAAVRGAVVAKMRNGGQACTAANRFYVASTLADRFAERLAEEFAGLTVGPGTEPGTEVGPLINHDAVDKVEGLVAEAVERGARPVHEDKRDFERGSFMAPVVLRDVRPEMALIQQEIFGPVAPVVPFEDDREAIEWANATEYGLVAYVFAGHMETALAFARRIESGMVGLNTGLISDASAPFGGVKHSGLGREGGAEGLQDYQSLQYLAMPPADRWEVGA